MIRKLLTTTALVGLLASGALAQQAPANNTMAPANNTMAPAGNTTMPANTMAPAGNAGAGETAPAAPPPGMVSEQVYSAVAGDNIASRILGSTVYTSAGDDADNIGDINDLVVTQEGNVAAAVIGVGGFLGIGEKNVAINFDQLQWTQAPDGTFRYVLNTTADALNAAPEFQYQDENNTDEPAANQASPGGNTTSGSGGAIVDANPNAANNAGAGNTTTMAPGAAAGGNAQAEGGGAPDRATLTPVDIGAMTAENLEGTEVYGMNDEEIGEIGDFVLNAQGQVDAVIIDVGGFLGIGEKQVAVGMDNLQFSQDQNGNRYLFLNVTQDQLNAQPEFNADTYQAERQTQRLVVTP